MEKKIGEKKSLQKDKPGQHNNYLRFSGIAVKMGVIIFAGVYGGLKLDEYLNFQKPVFVLIGSILSVALAIYSIIKDLSKL